MILNGKFHTVELADFINDASLKKNQPDVEFEDADTHGSIRKYENMYYRLVSKKVRVKINFCPMNFL